MIELFYQQKTEAEANNSSVMDEGVAGSTREESANFEGDVDGVSLRTDEDDSSDNFGEANLSSVLEDGAGGSAREEIAVLLPSSRKKMKSHGVNLFK